jgi:hypothetical protein
MFFFHCQLLILQLIDQLNLCNGEFELFFITLKAIITKLIDNQQQKNLKNFQFFERRKNMRDNHF